MTFGQQRMVEIILGEMRHAELFHHASRTAIANCGKRDDLVGLQVAEREVERGASAFRRVAAVPMLSVQPPADFDTGRERRFESRDGKSDEPGKRRNSQNLYGPQAKTMPLELRFDPLG